MSIPVVDFSVYNLSKKDATDGELQALSEELKRGFLQVGFVFLENSGISPEEVNPAEKTPKALIIASKVKCASYIWHVLIGGACIGHI